MFPESFVERYVGQLTSEGDYTFDPFSGRGTTVLQSLLMRRGAAAVDINPVAFCISAAKACVPELATIQARITNLENAFLRSNTARLVAEASQLPEFFHYAFRPSVLVVILFLRKRLRWRSSAVDRFIAALLLGCLHGEMDKSSSYLSNQMPRTISTKPEYSVRYWKKRKLHPPKRAVFSLLRMRAEYRLSTGRPASQGLVTMGDARDSGHLLAPLNGRVRAVITSPPYFNVTSYEEDQWLRLWFLGNQPSPTYRAISTDDRHCSSESYWEFLSDVWEGVSPLVCERKAYLVCRLAAKNVTRSELTERLYDSVLRAFPRAYLTGRPIVSKIRNKQSKYFRPGAKGCFFELDYLFSLR